MICAFQEHDLEQKIEVEIKMREGSARLLAAAKHRAQSLEAAKALLTSNERMSVYMAELQSRRRESIKKSWFVEVTRKYYFAIYRFHNWITHVFSLFQHSWKYG